MAKNLLSSWVETKELQDEIFQLGDVVFHIPFDGKNYLMFKCQRCGKCCRGQRSNALMLTWGDIQRLAQVFQQSPSNFLDQHCVFASPQEGKEVHPLAELPPVNVQYNGCYLKRFPEEDEETVGQRHACQFVTQDNLCRIYPHRPMTCRKYPYTTFHQPDGLTHAYYVTVPWSECQGYTPKLHLKKKWLSPWVNLLQQADQEIRESLEKGVMIITEIQT